MFAQEGRQWLLTTGVRQSLEVAGRRFYFSALLALIAAHVDAAAFDKFLCTHKKTGKW